MESFFKVFLMELMLFIKSIWVWLTTFFLVLYLVQGYYVFTIKDNKSVIQMLQASAYIVVAATLLGLLTGIVSAKKEKTVNFDEVFFSLPKTIMSPFAKLLAWCIVSLLVLVIPYIEILVLYNIKGIQTLNFELTSIIYILIYWGMPFFSCIIIGYSLSRIINSKLTYLFGSLICFLLSPFNKLILPQKFSQLFNQAEEEIGQIYNFYSGLNISLSVLLRHFLLFLLAICILCIVVIWRESIWNFKRQKIIVLSFSMICIILIILIAPTAGNRMSFSFNDLVSYNINYYTKNLENFDFKEESVKVDKYRINLNHEGEKFNYHISIFANNSNPNKGWVYFTLYNQFNISNLKLNGKLTEWNREGDFLYIKVGYNKNFRLDMEVQGSSNSRTLVTYNSLSLLSSFPWYPIPGKYKLFETQDSNILGNNYFKNVCLPYDTEFNIKVNQSKTVYSNLERVSENMFKGFSSGVTLLSGNLVQEEYKGISIVSPIEFINIIKRSLPELKYKIHEVENRLGKSGTKLPKNIFVVPFYNNILNAFSVESSCNQLLIDSQSLGNIFPNGELIFNCYNITSAFFIEDKYREKESLVLTILPNILEDLYSYRQKKSGKLYTESLIELIDFRLNYNKSKELIKLKQVLNSIVDLIKKGDIQKIEKIILKFYKEMDNKNSTVDLLESLVNNVKRGEQT